MHYTTHIRRYTYIRTQEDEEFDAGVFYPVKNCYLAYSFTALSCIYFHFSDIAPCLAVVL